jgi:signal transduction histidine kinase/CheY-like chemotaxis protein
LIPLAAPWRAAAAIATAATVVAYLALGIIRLVASVPLALNTAAGFLLVVVWAALVAEPIVRFWMVSRGLPAVQAWRLRSLSLGFAGIVLILVVAIAAGSLASNPTFQVAIEVMALVIVPLLYVSFSPPSWLRRQWRASEEEGLQEFMNDLLELNASPADLTERALDWAMRLAGGAAIAAFDGSGAVIGARSLEPEQVVELHSALAHLQTSANLVALSGSERAILVLAIPSLGAAARLVIVAGPFTPGFGGDESNRVQQFLSAVIGALDRARLLEELRVANVRLQEADKHKSTFLANMSHELRTPLNAILGFSELLIDSSNGQYPVETRTRFLGQINSSGKHLLGLINDILDLSKVEAGQMDLRLQTVPVAEVVDDVVRTVEPLAAQKQIRIAIETAGAGDIEADAGKLKQMVLNLASNAIKFTPDGGVITIKAARLSDHIELSISDTGIGIPEQDRLRIFEAFQQVDSGVDRRQPGTGLGLALTRRFARLHGGDVQVQSEFAKGSTFTISLPLRTEQRPAAQPVVPATGDTKDQHRPLILVVEDNAAAIELMTRNLDRGGFRTAVARSGTEAIAAARRLRPLAITLDILLPELDGWEVLTRLKHDPITSSIPVVVVSVVDNPELGMALGAIDYFVKPIDGAAFLKSLSRFNFRRATGRDEFRVLVVDDEVANREMLAEILEPAGFTVMSAAGGQEAIEMASDRLPDLVLLDLLMPDVTGFDVVEALRANHSTHDTPIMILTAKDLTDSDKQQLNGQVSTILNRRSTGASDLLGMLRQVVSDSTPSR